MAPETPRDGQPGPSEVITPPIGDRRADEVVSTNPKANKTHKHKNKLKERINSRDRTSYHRRDGGDAPGMGQVRPTPNELVACSRDVYRGRRDESNSRPDNSCSMVNPRDADPVVG